MSLHLAEIGRRVVPGSHAALVLDGAGYHVAKNLAVPHNITLVPLPPYAPELNPIENVWEYLRGNKLAITVSTVTMTFSTSPATPGHSSQTTTTASLPSQPDLGLRSIVRAVGMTPDRQALGIFHWRCAARLK
jgi:hypothetical protein